MRVMRKIFRKHAPEIALVFATVLSFVLMGCSIVMLKEYTKELEDQAALKGLLYATDISSLLSKTVQSYNNKTELLAEKIAANASDSADFSNVLNRMEASGEDKQFSDVMDIRYFKDGVEYSIVGDVYNKTLEAETVVRYSSSAEAVCAGLVNDKYKNISAVAFCAPIRNCAFADSIVAFYPPSIVTGYKNEVKEEYVGVSEITAVCSNEGEILEILSNNNYGLTVHNNIYEALESKTNSKEVIDKIRELVNAGSTGSFSVTVDGASHIISIGSVGKSGTSFSIIGLYRSAAIYSTGYTTINTILGALIIFFIILVFLALYFIISRRSTNNRILTINDKNTRLNCPSKVKFQRVAQEIITRNRGSNFAVVTIDLKHYRYLSEQLDRDSVTQILLYLKMLFSKSLRIDETYAYLDDGKFVLLYHYKNMESLSARVQMLSSVAGTYKDRLPGGYHIEFFGGIFEVPKDKAMEVRKMIDRANEAKDASTLPYNFASFRVYDKNMDKLHEQREYIEVHMNSALEQKHFMVFYQPKYNISNDRPDGSEALVRWYNPNTDEYMKPGIFMPLFEANRFVIKLDKYVYENVCMYISESVARGNTVYPVSVNVSRITATQKNFVRDYVEIKNKYNIADGFLTLEFTESFAFENYELLRETVAVLHENGFKCSIDDFGTGYSSYNLIKEIPMDEIKLDQFFIHRGISEKRDDIILENVIKLGKSLNMKVTQEGVQTPEQLERIKSFGCDVVQGYYYSKPLPLSDFIAFMEHSSHNSMFTDRL